MLEALVTERQVGRASPKIVAAHSEFGEIVRALELSEEEAINAAGEWLCMVILAALAPVCSEKEAHEVLNRSNESGHAYINDSWRSAVIAHRKYPR